MTTEYDNQREKARNEAIAWQLNLSNQDDYSMEDLWRDQQYFIALGKKYGLMDEFRENGII